MTRVVNTEFKLNAVLTDDGPAVRLTAIMTLHSPEDGFCVQTATSNAPASLIADMVAEAYRLELDQS